MKIEKHFRVKADGGGEPRKNLEKSTRVVVQILFLERIHFGFANIIVKYKKFILKKLS